MENKIEQGSQMITKFFAILEYMSENGGPVRLQDVSTYLKIPQTTVQRYLSSMIREGYVYQDEETLRYALTWKVCKIGTTLSTPLSAKSIVAPYVNYLARKMRMGASAMIAQGLDAIYLDLIDDPSTLLTSLMRIGNCPPLNSTASGKILLSRFSPYELENFYAVKGMAKTAKNTITDPQVFTRDLERVRQQGYATEIEECSNGVECVAVPVYDFKDSIYMALSVFDETCITEPERMQKEILPELCQCAKELSLKLGCSEAMLATYPF